MPEQIITKQYLRDHPNEIFVFGDNTLRTGYGGAASLRDEPNTYGFITKKYPDDNPKSFYDTLVYKRVFQVELMALIHKIRTQHTTTFLISKLGAGLANRNKIWENVIRDGLKCLSGYENVKFLYDDEQIGDK